MAATVERLIIIGFLINRWDITVSEPQTKKFLAPDLGQDELALIQRLQASSAAVQRYLFGRRTLTMIAPKAVER